MDYVEKMTIYGFCFYIIYTFMVIFLHNQNSLVWIQHGCLAYMVFSLDLSNSVIKRL